MSGLAQYLYAWNDWLVMPILLVVAVFAFLRPRRSSLLLVMFRISLCIAFFVLQALEPLPPNLALRHVLVMQYLGLLVGLLGFVWFWQQDRHARSMQSSPVPERDGR